MTTPHHAYPQYALPAGMVVRIILSVLLKQPRSFRRDSAAITAHLQPPLRVFGREHIPTSGSCVVTMNHYDRPGFDAWWVALAAGAVIPVEMHWIMTGAWTFPGKWYRKILRPISEWLFAHIARSYNFTTMPPMPPDPADTEARARAVRRVLAHARREPNPVIAIVPEGRDFPGGVLGWPPPGAGRFIHQLVRIGLRIVPVGIYEADGALCVSVGPPYLPELPDGLSTHERDRVMSRIVMTQIARQLPPHLRGDFDAPMALETYP